MLITHCKIDFELIEEDFSVKIISTVKISEKTGVEMEALHSVSVALLTIYDMCKAVSKSMIISEIKLEKNPAARVILLMQNNFIDCNTENFLVGALKKICSPVIIFAVSSG